MYGLRAFYKMISDRQKILLMYDHRQQNSPFVGIIWKPGLSISRADWVGKHYHKQNIEKFHSLRSII